MLWDLPPLHFLKSGLVCHWQVSTKPPRGLWLLVLSPSLLLKAHLPRFPHLWTRVAICPMHKVRCPGVGGKWTIAQQPVECGDLCSGRHNLHLETAFCAGWSHRAWLCCVGHNPGLWWPPFKVNWAYFKKSSRKGKNITRDKCLWDYLPVKFVISLTCVKHGDTQTLGLLHIFTRS